MNKKIIPQFNTDTQELHPNQALKGLSAFYKKRTRLLINHMRNDLHYTERQIAKLLGVTDTTLKEQYPKEVSK